MQDFETRDIQTYEELKQQLETCYQRKQSTAHLQLEINSLKQKTAESAQTFGQRADKLAMKLYNSMIEGENRSAAHKRAILETIQKQALLNFQLGLHDDLKILVRSQRYTTLQEAITGASAEEKLIGPTTSRTHNFPNRDKAEQNPSRQNRETAPQCYKCGKTGHYKRDCRSSKYALPKPDRISHVNTVEKICKYCKKRGHTRDECWALNGRPKPKTSDQPRRDNSDRNSPNDKKRGEQKTYQARNSDTESSSDEEREEKGKPTHAFKYQVTHIRQTPRGTTGLDLITLSIRETKNGKANMLYDSGATISLIKVNQLKGETAIYKDKITLIGITGHKARTIGKMYATIDLDGRKIKHAIYVVRNDFPMEHEGILGIDFLRKQQVSCDYKKRELKIGNAVLKLLPYDKITLKPRSETIVQAATDRNEIGVIQAEETAPGIYIGRCLVKPQNYSCPISVINTTDETIEIRTPLVKIEDLDAKNPHAIYTIQPEKTRNYSSRNSEELINKKN
ncbi:unnamed protein product [Lasius platythorax]